LKTFEWEIKTHNDSLNRTLNKESVLLPTGQALNNTYQTEFEGWKERLTFMTEKLKSISFEHLILLDQYIIYLTFKS